MDVSAVKHGINVGVSGQIALLRLPDTWVTTPEQHEDMFFFCLFLATIDLHWVELFPHREPQNVTVNTADMHNSRFG